MLTCWYNKLTDCCYAFLTRLKHEPPWSLSQESTVSIAFCETKITNLHVNETATTNGTAFVLPLVFQADKMKVLVQSKFDFVEKEEKNDSMTKKDIESSTSGTGEAKAYQPRKDPMMNGRPSKSMEFSLLQPNHTINTTTNRFCEKRLFLINFLLPFIDSYHISADLFQQI